MRGRMLLEWLQGLRKGGARQQMQGLLWGLHLLLQKEKEKHALPAGC